MRTSSAIQVLRLVAVVLVAIGISQGARWGENGGPAEASIGTLVSVPFFGQSIPGSDFVFVLDRSASMSWSGNFSIQQSETIAAIQSLTPDNSFSVVAFNDSATSFAPQIVPATDPNKQAAIAWVNALSTSGPGCPEAAITEAFALLDQSLFSPAILFVIAAPPQCQTSEAILAAIGGSSTSPIYPVALGSSSELFAFTQALALQSGILGAEFVRGDANGDGAVNIADGIFILQVGFAGLCVPFCVDAADVANDNVFEPLSDAVTLFSSLFIAGSPPIPAPFPDCGPAPEFNDLPCLESSCP